MVELGVIHGRFQIFHHDHLRYVLAGKMRCRHVVVGITNPDPTRTRSDAADPNRSTVEANPLTYYERAVMIRAALIEADLSPLEFSIVPFPINFPELYPYYLPMDATFYLTIYDQWGRRKLELFKSSGLKTEVLWERDSDHKGLRASDIRGRLLRGEPWKDFVSPGVASLLERWGIPERLRRFHGEVFP
ncbi:MAG: nicotinate-nucleotide adenylyltransferase [Syntrophobacteraceae bacterium]